MSDPKNERQAEMGVDESLTLKAARAGLEVADPDPGVAEQENDTPSSPEANVPELIAELEKYKDIALRSSADLDNYRKRVMREKEEAVRYANAAFLEKLIPILDNFEL
ncbi:MAG: nucleotide exchange factor GrpE, partial [Verrucomicrobia bacterium]|nr:nucleotide exchange factor GrpE [Verrucomicrobiota bacterium]